MSARFVPLEGVRNFRDFGGYASVFGGRVRLGLLYRSAHFAEATPADIETLHALGCAALVDLRRPQERQWQPNKWPAGAGVAVHASTLDDGEAEPPHLAFLRSGELTPEGVDAFMRATYAALPFLPSHVEAFRAYFAALAAGGGACVIHCAAGKDRTGVLAAVTLLALGVAQADVLEDYLLTNQVAEFETRLPALQKALEAYAGRTLPLEALRPFAGVREAWLGAALGAIEARHGGVDGYLEAALGLDPAARARMREGLLG